MYYYIPSAFLISTKWTLKNPYPWCKRFVSWVITSMHGELDVHSKSIYCMDDCWEFKHKDLVETSVLSILCTSLSSIHIFMYNRAVKLRNFVHWLNDASHSIWNRCLTRWTISIEVSIHFEQQKSASGDRQRQSHVVRPSYKISSQGTGYIAKSAWICNPFKIALERSFSPLKFTCPDLISLAIFQNHLDKKNWETFYQL